MFFLAALERNIPFLINFAFTILIARLVPPEIYGLVAMTAILTALAQVVQSMGFSSALVQRDILGENDQTTVFFTNVGVGGLIALALILLAEQIANFFGHAEIITVVQVNAAATFVAALGIVQTAMLQREYRFRTGLIIETSAALLAGCAALFTALQGFDLWALLLLILVREVTRTVLLWRLICWRPQGRFSREAFRSMWGFARHMIGASLYHHIAMNLSSVLLGKLYPPAILGLFGRAQSLQALPVSLMTQPAQRVAFPLYARSQNDLGALRDLLRKHSRVVAILAGGVTAALVTCAPEIILILVGPAWVDAVPMLQVLGLAAFFNVTFPLHSEANKAIGNSRWFFWAEVAKKSLLVLIVVIGIMAGLIWLLWGLVFASLLDYLLSAMSSVRFLGYSWRQQLVDIGPAFCLSILSMLLLQTVIQPWLSEIVVLALLAKIATIVALFCVAVLVFGRSLFPEVHIVLARLTTRVTRRAA